MDRRTLLKGLFVAPVALVKGEGRETKKTGVLEPGERVHIADEMPGHMSHYKHGCDATICYSHHQHYESMDYTSKPLIDGVDMNEYHVIIDGYGPVSWYPASLLTRI